MLLPKLCCQVNMFVKCYVCKSQFCEECWRIDKSHVLRDKFNRLRMKCPATGWHLMFASCAVDTPASLIRDNYTK